MSRHDQRVRPDVVVRLPGDKHLVVDSKAPMRAFLAAQADDLDGSERGRLLREHAASLKSHVTSLMTKLGVRNRVEVAMWAYETNRSRRHR